MKEFLRSIWQYRCPRCRSKDSYLFVRPFNYKKPLDMPRQCAVCKQRFEPEPGFYFGAMFISYTISIVVLLPLALILIFYFGWPEWAAMIAVFAVGALFFFRILRLSRSVWIHLMVRYKQ